MSITVSQSIPLPFPLWYPYVCFLCLCLHFCFVHEFIYTISSRFHICVFLFLTSCYMIVSRSSHISANGTISYLFMAEQYSIIYVPHLCQSKGEKERYKHLNAEFQRIARRNKKAFLSDQCKEIEENNRMGKTRDLFKKIRDTKGTSFGWAPKNWCFWTVVLEKTLESPLDCKEIQPVHSKGDQSWVFIGKTDAKAETPILWPPHWKSWLIGKDPDAGRDWGQEEKGTAEDEMAAWHHQLNGHEFK